MTHECPGPGCEVRVPAHQLACRRHWFQVPAGVRKSVYAAWDGGLGAGTPEHQRAMARAIAAMKP